MTTVTSPSGPAPAHLYALDVNNDGFTDILQDNAQSAASFSVSICNGDGTFKAPVTYAVPATGSTPDPLTWGDFNGDGKVDIVIALAGTAQLAVYLGNGDGTFQPARTVTLSLPPNAVLAAASIVAGDFNQDGKVDLVASAHAGSAWSVDLLTGDGAGGFTNPAVIYTPTSGWSVQTLVSGDFDTDDHDDVGVLESMPCSDGNSVCQSNVLALFGNGDASFAPIDVTTVNGSMTLGASDLDGDGASDLYGIEASANELATFLGHYDRAFTYYYSPITPSDGGDKVVVSTPVVAAPFDGGRSNMLVALQTSFSPDGAVSQSLIYFFGGTSYSSPATDAYATPPTYTFPYQVGPAVGNFNGDVLPDLVTSGSSAANAATSTLGAGLNDYTDLELPLCPYPTVGRGIRLCSPSSQTTSGQMTVAASASSFGQLRKIELWLDGAKQFEEHNVWGQEGVFQQFFSNPSLGTHHATLYAADVDNTLQRLDFDFTVGNTCGPPPQGAYGVNLCTPTMDGTYTGPLQVAATAHITGTLARMEIWMDGVKQYTETTSTSLNTTLNVAPGYHIFDIYAVNTAGQKWKTSIGVSED